MLNPSKTLNGKRKYDYHSGETFTHQHTAALKKNQPSHPNTKKISPGEMWQCSKIVHGFIYRPGRLSSSACWKYNHGATDLFAPLSALTVRGDAGRDAVSSALFAKRSSSSRRRAVIGAFPAAESSEGGAQTEILRSLMEYLCTPEKTVMKASQLHFWCCFILEGLFVLIFEVKQ